MDERKAAGKILCVLKEERGHFVSLRDLARKAGFHGAHVRDFKNGFKLLEQQKIVKLYHSGWPSEGYHRTMVVLLADIYAIEDIEKELKGESWIEESSHNIPESQVQDLKLVAVRTPGGEISYISKQAYDREKKGANFWQPLSSKKPVHSRA